MDLRALGIFLAIGLIAGFLASFVVGGGGLIRYLITGVIGAFVGATPQDIACATAAGLSCYGIAGEIAAQKSTRPMAFKLNLMDSMHALSAQDIVAMQRVES